MGGGRILSANAGKNRFAESGSSFKVATGTNSIFSRAELIWGKAAWTAMQTAHLAASVALEWWWAAIANTDQIVSSKQIHATFLARRCMSLALGTLCSLKSTPKQHPSATKMPSHTRLTKRSDIFLTHVLQNGVRKTAKSFRISSANRRVYITFAVQFPLREVGRQGCRVAISALPWVRRR